MVTAIRRNSSARALGMNEFCGVGGKRQPCLAIFRLNHFEYVSRFDQRRFPCGHQGITAWHRRYFSYPAIRLVAVEHDLIVFERQGVLIVTPLRRTNTCATALRPYPATASSADW